MPTKTKTKKTQRVRPTVKEVRELIASLEATQATVKTQATLIDEIRILASRDGAWLSSLQSKVKLGQGLLVDATSFFIPPPDLGRRIRAFCGVDSPENASRVSQRLSQNNDTPAPDRVAGN